MASSSSVMSRRNYGVFLSFRGPDTRNTIVSHLYPALCQKGVHTFKDSEELEAGQRRSDLFHAIEGSHIAVVTFSERYANSKWCLDELTKIMTQKKEGKIDVIPIFYRVSPGEVRLHEKEKGVKGCYQVAMEEMEEKYGPDSEMVKGWRKALWEGGDLIGFLLPEREDEGKVVQNVVNKVLKILNRVPLEVAKYPVGISSRLEEIEPLLCMDPQHVDEVHMIGIHGVGGGGKTTLSKAICNYIAHHFDAWCFLPNVRETSGAVNGLVLLQQMLLCELSDQKELIVTSIDAGKVLIPERLCHKRVLLILDDVDQLNQLNALAGNAGWFGRGSRIIITSRDSQVLILGRVRHIFKVRLLDDDEADNLFRCHAFDESKPNVGIDRVLIDRFLAYADRLPLALEVLGSSLWGSSESEWEKTLEKLDKNPNKSINSVLKISFDGLDDLEKEIFLDIACFFKGSAVNYVSKVLDTCGFASISMDALVKRCMVTVERGAYQMHDLLEVMGKSIVRDEKKVGIPSRIWDYEDFQDVFSEHVESYDLKGIVLDLPQKQKKLLDRRTFEGLKRLRLLIVRNAFDPDGSLHLPGHLKWFEWPRYSETAITFGSSRRLVGLDLWQSSIKRINLEELKELKYLILSHCESLDALPDLSESSNLVHLYLDYCNLNDLEFLKDLTCLITLTRLSLSGNGSSKVPECISKFENLEELWLCDCQHLQDVPDLPNLFTLLMTGCRNLQTFPSLHTFFCRSRRRFYADLSGCCGLDPIYIHGSLLHKKIREFGGIAEIIVPGEEIPIWMTFQTMECDLNYRVSLPEDILEDDILGLAFCVTFKAQRLDVWGNFFYFLATHVAGKGFGRTLGSSDRNYRESGHTWFVYLPRQPLSVDDAFITDGRDWRNITIQFFAIGVGLRRCGFRVICRREKDEERFVVRKSSDRSQGPRMTTELDWSCRH